MTQHEDINQRIDEILDTLAVQYDGALLVNPSVEARYRVGEQLKSMFAVQGLEVTKVIKRLRRGIETLKIRQMYEGRVPDAIAIQAAYDYHVKIALLKYLDSVSYSLPTNDKLEEESQDWEKRFDEHYSIEQFWGMDHEDVSKLKSFIRSLLSTYKDETSKKG